MSTTSPKAPARTLRTRNGDIACPAYIPVTTFGKKYPLDELIRPYLRRLAPAIMVSYHYARQKNTAVRLPMMVDSGGFASLFANASVSEEAGLGVITLTADHGTESLHPAEVLDFQEQHADIGFTLDFPIPMGTEPDEAQLRQRLTIANAIWTLANRRRRDLLLFGCVQGWDEESYLACAETLAQHPFDGLAIGGLVPRAKDTALILRIVESVRKVAEDKPVHVFGLGAPELARKLFRAGADSVDSSSYVKLAADGRSWGNPTSRIASPTPTQRLHLALNNLATANGRALPLGSVQRQRVLTQ